MSSEFKDLNFVPLFGSSSSIGNEDEEIGLENEAVVDVQEEIDESEGRKTFSILNGHLLPLQLRPKVRNKLTGIGLQEIDPSYRKNDTFVVIGRGSRIVYRFGEATSFVKSNGGWRHQAIAILTHGVFNYFLVFAILMNCIFYGTTPFEAEKAEELPAAVDYEIFVKVAHYVFLAIYILEFYFKIMARGFCKTRDPFSALRISWTWLDMFVIVVGILSIANPSNRILGALNGFRALKLIPLIPSWLSGYDLLLRKTFKGLCNAAVFTFVLTLLLAMIGADFYSDTLRHKCVLNTTLVKSNESGQVITEDAFLKYPNSSEYQHCGISKWSIDSCPSDYACVLAGENPGLGNIGFDSFSVTKFTLLNLISQDFAEYVYEKIWTIHGPPHILYFIVVFFLGTFCTGILFIAVIGSSFEKGFSDLKLELDDKDPQQSMSTEVENVVPTVTNWEKFRSGGARIVIHDNFDLLITLVVIFNVVTLTLDYHGVESNPGLFSFLRISDKLIRFAYCLECVLKIVFLGFKTYWRKTWNRFDFFVAIFIAVDSSISGGFLHSGIMFTVLKVVPRWPALNFLFVIMTKWIWVQWIIGLNGIALFLFAYIGYVSFGDAYSANSAGIPKPEILEVSRWNMTDFWHSLRLIFRSFCGEWIESMWDLALIFPGAASISFMISCGVVTNFLRKCLGLGIMLTTTHQLTSESEMPERKFTSLERIFRPCISMTRKITRRIENENEEEDAGKDAGEAEGFKEATTDELNDKRNAARMMLEKILEHFGYRVFTCTLIVTLTVLVIYEELAAEIFFVSYFGLELIMRVAAVGFERKLLSAGLIFDASMVLNSILALSHAMPYGVGHLGTFRLLMMVSRIRGLRIILRKKWELIKSLREYFIATIFVWFTFALFGVQLFMGTFYKCTDADGKRTSFNKVECLDGNYTWGNSPQNFDSTPNGLGTLFYVATRNGWVNAIADAEDSTYENGPMQKEASPAAMIYFMAFLIFGVLFPSYTLFGLMYHKFKQNTWIQAFEVLHGGKNNTGKVSVPKSDSAQSPAWDSKLTKYVTHPYFELWVCLTIIADVVACALQLSTTNTDHELGLNIFRHFIFFLYTVELILRGLTLKKAFFKEWLNDLLLVIVLGSIVDTVVIELGHTVYSFAFLRILRLLHLLSLDRVGSYKFREFGAFRRSLSNAFPALSCMLTLYALMYVSYGIFGAVTFTGVDDFTPWNVMTTLFKIATISGWEGIYDRIAQGECKEADGCGHPVIGAAYEVTFITITVFCFVNMYFTLIMEIMEQLKQGETKVSAGGKQAIGKGNNAGAGDNVDNSDERGD